MGHIPMRIGARFSAVAGIRTSASGAWIAPTWLNIELGIAAFSVGLTPRSGPSGSRRQFGPSDHNGNSELSRSEPCNDPTTSIQFDGRMLRGRMEFSVSRAFTIP